MDRSTPAPQHGNSSTRASSSTITISECQNGKWKEALYAQARLIDFDFLLLIAVASVHSFARIDSRPLDPSF
jgi:hypothetical protein